jgi:hypothetical protein
VKTFNLTGGPIVKDSENRKLQTYIRARSFGQAHASDFAPTSLATQELTKLAGIIDRLEGHGARQTTSKGAARQGTDTRAEARDEVREDLRAIVRTARVMDEDTPGLAARFRLPEGNNDQVLLNTGRAAFAELTADAALAAQFIAHELPADFLADLNNDLAALETAMTEQADGMVSGVSQRVAIETEIDEGDATMRRLGAIMKNKYANNPAVLAEWTSASHTERAPRRKKKTENPGGGGSNTPPAATGGSGSTT